MILAQLRGVKFKLEGKYYIPQHDGANADTAFECVREVARQFGYDNYMTYLNDLPLLKRKIFKRSRA